MIRIAHTCCDSVALSFHLHCGFVGSLFIVFAFTARLEIIGLELSEIKLAEVIRTHLTVWDTFIRE